MKVTSKKSGKTGTIINSGTRADGRPQHLVLFDESGAKAWILEENLTFETIEKPKVDETALRELAAEFAETLYLSGERDIIKGFIQWLFPKPQTPEALLSEWGTQRAAQVMADYHHGVETNDVKALKEAIESITPQNDRLVMIFDEDYFAIPGHRIFLLDGCGVTVYKVPEQLPMTAFEQKRLLFNSKELRKHLFDECLKNYSCVSGVIHAGNLILKSENGDITIKRRN